MPISPEQRLNEVKAKIQARTDGGGQPLPGFKRNVGVLRDMERALTQEIAASKRAAASKNTAG